MSGEYVGQQLPSDYRSTQNTGTQARQWMPQAFFPRIEIRLIPFADALVAIRVEAQRIVFLYD